MIDIDIPNDAYLGLPPTVAAEVDQFLFGGAEEVADELGEAVFSAARLALERLIDEVGDDNEAIYRAEMRRRGPGIIEETFTGCSRGLTAAVAAHMVTGTLEDNLVLLHSLRRIGRDFADLSLDDEKALGHLIIVHGIPAEKLLTAQDDWYSTHRRHHLSTSHAD
jgi:hypothetical protein